MSAVLTALGVRQEQQASCLAVIDKAGRTRAETTRQRLRETGLDDSAVSVLSELAADGSWGNLRRCFSGHEAVSAAMGPLEEHRSILKAMGLDSFVEFDFKIVRGLAYYTGIVFELFDRDSELRAICGGGRYDRLLELVGGEPLPAVGFGMGDVVLGELLRTRGFLPAASPPADYFVAVDWARAARGRLGRGPQAAAGGTVCAVFIEAGHGVGKAAARGGAGRGESCADYRLRRGCGRQRNRTELANRTTGNPTDGFLVDGGRSGAVSQKGTGTSLNARQPPGRPRGHEPGDPAAQYTGRADLHWSGRGGGARRPSGGFSGEQRLRLVVLGELAGRVVAASDPPRPLCLGPGGSRVPQQAERQIRGQR